MSWSCEMAAFKPGDSGRSRSSRRDDGMASIAERMRGVVTSRTI